MENEVSYMFIRSFVHSYTSTGNQGNEYGEKQGRTSSLQLYNIY